MTNIVIGIILVGLIGLAVGLALGLGIASLRGHSAGKPSRQGNSVGMKEVLRLYQDPTSQGLVPALEGRIYRKRSTLPVERAARMQEIVNHLIRWLEPGSLNQGGEIAHDVPTGIPQAGGEELSSPPASDTLSIPSPREAAASIPLPQAPSVTSTSMSIVAQVDEILQEMIAGTPLENRHLSLGESPDTGVIVWIGAEKYLEIDAIPDPQIQQAIREAVKEWEKRQQTQS